MEKKKDARRKSVKALPEGFHTVTPYLVVDNADKFLEFVKEAFNGEVTIVSRADKNKIVHATVKIGDSTIMVADTMEGMPTENAMLYLYVEDADAVFQDAIDAKGKSARELKTEFYGDRTGAIKDAWGNTWWIATHVEDVDPEELKRRAKEAYKEMKEKGEHVEA